MCVFVCVTLLSKVVFRPIAKVLPGVSEHHKDVMCLTEKLCVLDKVLPGMGHSQHTGHEFNVRITTIYILSKMPFW